MAPNKFETQLKDTLERRKIAPSDNAWSQLKDQLDKEERKRKFPMWWLGIAATLVGVLFAVLVVNNKEQSIDSIVEDTKDETIKIEKPNNTINKTLIVEESNNIEVEKTKNETKNEVIKQKKNSINNKYQSNQAEKYLVNNVINNKTETKVEELTLAQNISNNKTEIINKENTEVVLADNQSTQEATQLLDEAFSKISVADNTYKTEKIDAESLLEEVELESDISLKNRLFQAVKSGYETVKTAVVERDQ